MDEYIKELLPIADDASETTEKNILRLRIAEERIPVYQCGFGFCDTCGTDPPDQELSGEALDYILTGKYDRQVIDCLRLALELFLKQLLRNNKSLENQMKALGVRI